MTKFINFIKASWKFIVGGLVVILGIFATRKDTGEIVEKHEEELQPGRDEINRLEGHKEAIKERLEEEPPRVEDLDHGEVKDFWEKKLSDKKLH